MQSAGSGDPSSSHSSQASSAVAVPAPSPQTVLVLLDAALAFTVKKPVVGLAPKKTRGKPNLWVLQEPSPAAGAVLPHSLRANLSLCCAWQSALWLHGGRNVMVRCLRYMELGAIKNIK